MKKYALNLMQLLLILCLIYQLAYAAGTFIPNSVKEQCSKEVSDKSIMLQESYYNACLKRLHFSPPSRPNSTPLSPEQPSLPPQSISDQEENSQTKKSDGSPEKLCESYGLKMGTEAYANCMLKIREQDLALKEAQEQKETDEQTRQQREEQARINTQNKWSAEYQQCINKINSYFPPTIMNGPAIDNWLGRCKQDPTSWHELPQQSHCYPDDNGGVICQTL